MKTSVGTPAADPRVEPPGHRWLPAVLAGGSLTVSALVLPLGLHRIAAARPVADAILMQGNFSDGSGTPIAALPARLLLFLPAGDLAARVAIAAAVVLAIAAVLHARLLGDVLSALRPRLHARLTARDLVHEPIAITGGVAVILLAPPLVIGYTAADAGAMAATLCMLAAGLHAAFRTLGPPPATRDALLFFLTAGLAVGVDPIVPALLWPVALLIWVRGLRQGDRWPLLAPLTMAMGASIALLTLALAEPGTPVFDRLTLPGLRSAWDGATSEGARRSLLGLVNAAGMIASLLAIVGIAALGACKPAAVALFVFALWVALLSASAGSSLGQAVLTALMALPVAAGIAYLAGRFGRARAATAVVLAIVATVSPALSGGRTRWMPDARLPAAVLDRALENVPPRGSVDPGSPEMRDLMRYGRAIGIRPDLGIRAARPAAR